MYLAFLNKPKINVFVMQSKKLSDKLSDRITAQAFAHNYFIC